MFSLKSREGEDEEAIKERTERLERGIGDLREQLARVKESYEERCQVIAKLEEQSQEIRKLRDSHDKHLQQVNETLLLKQSEISSLQEELSQVCKRDDSKMVVMRSELTSVSSQVAQLQKQQTDVSMYNYLLNQYVINI